MIVICKKRRNQAEEDGNEEQKYLWSVLMQPDVNRYYLTVPKKYADKLKDWNKQEEYYKNNSEYFWSNDG